MQQRRDQATPLSGGLASSCLVSTLTLTFLVSISRLSAEGLLVEAQGNVLTANDTEQHAFQVTYQSDCGILLDSLGDDDIVVGRYSLFGAGLGSSAPFARYIDAEVSDQGRTVVATYELDRPKDGWRPWHGQDFTIQVLEESVLDLEHHTYPTRIIGMLRVDLHDPWLPIRTTVASSLVVEDLLQPFLDIELSLVAESEVVGQQFGHHLLLARGRVATHPAQRLALLPNEDGVTASALYRLFRPDRGWEDLRLYAQALPAPFAEEPMGPISVASAQKLQIVLRTREAISPGTTGDYHFEIAFTKTGTPLDEDSLDDHDLVIEQPLNFMPVGLLIGKPVLVASRQLSQTDQGQQLIALYRVPRPAEGWGTWKGFTPTVRLLPGAVLDTTKQSVPTGRLGTLPLKRDLMPKRQQLVFEDWVRDLSKQLGLRNTPRPNTDKDGDGKDDLTETAMGTDPEDPSEVSPITVNTARDRLGGRALELGITTRPLALGTYVRLEGSTDGEDWEDASRWFEITLTEQHAAAFLERRVLRLSNPLGDLKMQLFRLRLLSP